MTEKNDMTVGELIDRLSKYPKDMPVSAFYNDPDEGPLAVKISNVTTTDTLEDREYLPGCEADGVILKCEGGYLNDKPYTPTR